MNVRRVAALALVACTLMVSTVSAQSANRILVMPFENVAHDGRIVWLGEAAAVLLVDHLNARNERAITREERRDAFAHLQIPLNAPLSDATTIRIGQLVGASRIVLGTLQREGDDLVVRARSMTLESGRVETLEAERAPLTELFPLFERIATRVMTASTVAPAPPAYPSILAFENYIKGLLAETPATALSYLNASIRAQPTFDRARLAMWEVYDEQGDHDRALATVSTILQTSGVYRRARFLVALSQLNLQRHDAAFQVFKLLADTRATAPLLNNMGVVQSRRSGPPLPGAGVATYYFNKAAESDPTDSDYFFNLGYACWFEHDYASSAYWLREAVRRAPADGEAHYVLGAALTAVGNVAEANREKELARRLSSTYAEWEKRSAAEIVPRGLERLKLDADLPRIDRIEASLANTGLRDQQELARFYLDRGRRLFDQERDREAVAELNRTLFLAPYEADAHLLIGRMHLRAGRWREAIEAFKIAVWSRDTEEAHSLLAQAYLDNGEIEDARTEARRALVMNPTSAAAAAVLQKIAER